VATPVQRSKKYVKKTVQRMKNGEKAKKVMSRYNYYMMVKRWRTWRTAASTKKDTRGKRKEGKPNYNIKMC